MSSSRSRSRPPTAVANGRFEISKKLGAGCFGEVYRGHNTETKAEVAVKFEDLHGHALQLEHECEILRLLGKPALPQGVAEVFHFGREGPFHCMVIELLGKSLEDRVQQCRGRFGTKSTLLVADQVLRRL